MSKTQKTKMISPKDAKSERDMLSLNRTVKEVGDLSILFDEFNVWLGEQKSGEGPTQKYKIPKRDFDKLISWYTTPQKVKP